MVVGVNVTERTSYLVRNKQDLERLQARLNDKVFGEYGYVVEIITGRRTKKQNNAMHLYCEELANVLNAAGLDMRTVFNLMKEGIEIPWSKLGVKEKIWKPIMEAMTEKASTGDQDRIEASQVYEAVNWFTSTRLGVSVEWPSRERQEREALARQLEGGKNEVKES